MRWLLLFAVAVLGAVGLWWVLGRGDSPGPAIPVAEPARRTSDALPPSKEPVRSAIPADEGAVRAEPAPVGATPPDAGAIVHTIFEQVDAKGRVAGTRFYFHRDGGDESGLADAMGIAHIDVPEGDWLVHCSSGCGELGLTIAPGYDHFILPTLQTFELSGTVVDADDRPVATARVDLIAGGESRSAVTLVDGSFHLTTSARNAVLIASMDEDKSSPKTISLPTDKPVKLVLRPTSWVRFSFPGFRSEPVEMTSSIGTETFSYSIDEYRRVRLPAGDHEAVARTWANGKTFVAKAMFRVYPEKRRNFVEIVLREQPGLRAAVTDVEGKPLGGVEVLAYSWNERQFDVDGGCALLVREDCGRSCAEWLRPDVNGVTDAAGIFEATPVGHGAEPLYRLTVGGLWREQHPALMRLGDDPLTIVAVPR